MISHPHTWLGIVIFTLLFYVYLILSRFQIGAGDHWLLYLVGFVTVLAGTLGAAFFSYATTLVSG